VSRRSRFLETAAATAATLAAAALGGLAFAGLGMPAPWVSGALIFTLALAMVWDRVRLPEALRFLAFIILGASMGAVLTPQTLAAATAWPLSMACLAVSIVGTMGASVLFLTKVAGWNLPTAFYAAAPGAFSSVIAMAEETDADLRRVAFAQTVRLFLLVAALPNVLGVAGFASGGFAPPAHVSPALQVAVLLVVATGAGFAFEWLRVPGGLLVGAMAGSGALHLSGLSNAVLPPVLLEPAFIILGASVGVRFLGTTLAALRAYFLVSLGAFVVAVAVAAACAAVAARLTGTDFGMLLTAFAPGGLDTMTALGFAMGYDPAFMSAHHLFRFVSLSFALPLAATVLFSAKADAGMEAPPLEPAELAADPPRESERS